MLTTHPAFHVLTQLLRQPKHLLGLLIGNGPHLVIHNRMSLLPEGIEEIDHLALQADGEFQALDCAKMLVLSLGLVPGRGEGGSCRL